MRSIEDLLGPAPDEREETRNAAIARLNKRHAVVAHGGQVRVIREDGAGGFTMESVRAFEDWYANDVIWEEGKAGPIATPVSSVWFASPQRRQYEQIVLDPRGKRRGAYNLWKGFSVASERGDCSLFLDHLFDNVCGGDEALYTWLVGWMAHLVQRPWEKPGTAVVLKGEKGVGKSIVGEILGTLIARHFLTVTQPRHLVGNFNSHLATAVLVLVEEAFWAGDKVGEGVLKDLITGPRIMLEKKGVDAIPLDSFHRFIITSNAHWVVPATHDERRFAVFNVGDAHRQDGPYFEAIKREMERGGYEALLHYLGRFDLSCVDVRRVPNTEGLTEQKLAGLRNVEAWWWETLAAGDLTDCRHGAEWNAAIRVEADDLRTYYKTWMQPRRTHGDVLGDVHFANRLAAMCPRLEHKRARVRGGRVYFYELPALAACREAFESWCNSAIDWEDAP
jgi:hypothetical protein